MRRSQDLDNGTLRYKARLVIKGYEQMQGISFDETYAPVIKMTTLRYLISRAVQKDWEMDELDVITAFLNPAINKEVYMQLPEGIKWLIAELLSSPSSSLSPADSTHISTHNPCTEAHSVSRAKERFVELTWMLDGNSRMSTVPGNLRVNIASGNLQRMSTEPGNSLCVNMVLGNSCMSMASGNSPMSMVSGNSPMSMVSGNSQRMSTVPSNSQRVNMALGNSCMSTAPSNSHVNTAPSNSQRMNTVPGN